MSAFNFLEYRAKLYVPSIHPSSFKGQEVPPTAPILEQVVFNRGGIMEVVRGTVRQKKLHGFASTARRSVFVDKGMNEL